MVVGKEEFNRALREINESYAKVFVLIERVEKLEQQVKELQEAQPKRRTANAA